MQNLLEEILKKHSEINAIDYELIKKIMELQIKFYGNDNSTKLNQTESEIKAIITEIDQFGNMTIKFN